MTTSFPASPSGQYSFLRVTIIPTSNSIYRFELFCPLYKQTRDLNFCVCAWILRPSIASVRFSCIVAGGCR